MKDYSSPDSDIMGALQLPVIVYGWWSGGAGVCGLAQRWRLAVALPML